MKVVEMYYTVPDLCFLLRFSDSYIRRQIKAGQFGPREAIVQIGDGQLRIPASGVNFFLAQHAMEPPAGIAARSLGELRRKVAAERAVQTSGAEEANE